MASPSETISLSKILSDSRSIIRSHLYHFQALAVLFVFPLSLCVIFYPTIQATFLSQPQSSSTHLTKIPHEYILATLLYSIFVSLFSLCAVATISYSAYRAFYQEPVTLIESIKSIFNSFLPLVSTLIVSELILALITIPLIALAFLLSKWLNLSSSFLVFVIFISLVYVLLLIYIQVNWILAYVVVVVESKWGYEPLQRSALLIKGNRGVALLVLLCFGLISGGFFLGFYGVAGSWSWRLFVSVCLSYIVLNSFVANVVLYVYCRDLHEGLPSENTKNCALLK